MRLSIRVALLTLCLVNEVAAAPAAHATPRSRTAGAPVASTTGRTLPLFPPIQFEKLGLDEGLPQIHVTSVTQDKRGFVWFGTQAGGLARFDGTHMVPYSTGSDPTTVSSQFITALEVDASGAVWVGTGDAGLNLYDPATNQFTRFRHGPAATSIGFDAVTVLARAPDGTLWIGLGNGGVDRFDASTKTFQHVVPESSVGEISAIQPDGNDRLYVASNGGGVMVISSLKTPRVAWLPSNDAMPHTVTALCLDREGTLWIGTDDDGLFRLAKGASTLVSYLPKEGDRRSLSNAKITTLFEDRGGSLWVGTQFGLNELDPARSQITRYAPDPEFPLRTTTYLQYVTTAFQDRAGTLWFGTLDFGVYKLDPIRRAFHDYAGTAEFGIPMAFCESTSGVIWAGTYTNGLYKFDLAKNEYTEYAKLGTAPDEVVLTNWLTAVHCDRDGSVWLGGSGLGLVGFDPVTGRVSHYAAADDGSSGPAADRIEQIVQGADGALWLATWGGGLGRFDPASRTFSIVAKDEPLLASPYVHRILFDLAKPHVMWIGAALGGVTRLDLDSKTSKVYRGPHTDATKAAVAGELSNDTAQTLYQSPDGIVWIGTSGGGLDRLDPVSGKVAVFGEAEGVPGVVYGILPDDEQRLWLTTARGLIRFDPKTSATVKFTSADGLASTEFNQNAYFRSKSGEMFVGSLTGFNRFSPKEIVPDPVVPPVVVTGFRIFDKEATLAKQIWDTPKIDLSYRDSQFTVDFAALGFVAPKLTQFSYMLEGFRDEWVTTERGQVTFTNLDGGDYVLKVRAKNRHGLMSETPATLAIHVAPPIWKSKPAYVLYVLLVIGLGVLVTYLQRQRLLRAVREGRLAVIEHDLQLSGAVQNGFLPAQDEITSEQLHIMGFYRPADMCSGDWWWHERLDAHRHLVLVGDVTGHGPGPAMVTAAVATAFHVATIVKYDVEQMLELLDKEVLRVAKGQYHMTLAVVAIDETTGQWDLYSAGAPPILTLDQGGRHRVHFCPGTMLGSGELFEVGHITGQLKPGERILISTDGIPEIEMLDGNVLGMRRFGQLYEGTRGIDVRAAVAAIVDHADRSQAGRPQLDDWTFTMVEWGAAAGKPTT